MIAFCTHCWKEMDAEHNRCPHCGANLDMDKRSYQEKLVGALDHPLPAARVRICWLIGENRVGAAVPALMQMAGNDPDLYVQRAALEALGVLRDRRAVPLLVKISDGKNRFLAAIARKSLKESTMS